MTPEQIIALGFYAPRWLPSGEWAALQRLMFTTGLFVGVDHPLGYRTRWCYEHATDAEAAISEWDGNGDPPGLWIKQKPEDRLNPAWAKAEPA